MNEKTVIAMKAAQEALGYLNKDLKFKGFIVNGIIRVLGRSSGQQSRQPSR